MTTKVRMYKTQLHISTQEQANFFQDCFSAKNYLYNLYLRTQFGLLYTRHKLYPDDAEYKKLDKQVKDQFFLSGFSFEKEFNHVIRVSNTFPQWILKLPQKTRKQAFIEADTAFKRYFKGLAGSPRYKGKGAVRSCYFDGSIHIERDRVKLPKLGWIRLSEYGYLPTDIQLAQKDCHITGCWVKEDCGKYYITIMTNEEQQFDPYKLNSNKVVGVDLGIKDLAITEDKTYINITKTSYYKHLENYKKLWEKRFNRRIAYLKRELGIFRIGRHTTKGIATARRQMKKWRKKLRQVNSNYIRQVTASIVKQKPTAIVLENLNVKGMKSNPKLAPSIQKLGFYQFKDWLTWLCKKHGIELRQVSQWYPSTKICSNCGFYNHEQFKHKLTDLAVREFHCNNCSTTIDRDLNASKNLANAKDYEILVPAI